MGYKLMSQSSMILVDQHCCKKGGKGDDPKVDRPRPHITQEGHHLPSAVFPQIRGRVDDIQGGMGPDGCGLEVVEEGVSSLVKKYSGLQDDHQKGDHWQYLCPCGHSYNR